MLIKLLSIYPCHSALPGPWLSRTTTANTIPLHARRL